MKSFKPKGYGDDDDAGGRNAPADFKGQLRSNATHASPTDPDALLYRKGPGMEAKLCFIGHCPVGSGAGPQPRSDRAI